MNNNGTVSVGGKKRFLREWAGRLVRPAFALALLLGGVLYHGDARGENSAPAGEVVTSSFNLVLKGYVQTVTVNTTPDKMIDYLADPENYPVRGMGESGRKMPVGDREARPGVTYKSDLNPTGLGLVKGNLIVIKHDDENRWFIWDLPEIFQSRKWRFSPIENGTRITYRVDTQIPEQGSLSLLKDWVEKRNRDAFNEMDLHLANAQASFDPSLNKDELLSNGLRGESYETVYQAHRAEVMVKAPRDRIIKWLEHPDVPYLRLAPQADSCPYQKIPESGILYCRTKCGYVGREVPAEAFIVESGKRGEYSRRIYILALNQVHMVKIILKPKLAGTSVQITWISETPDSTSPLAMDQITFSSTILEMVTEGARQIKAGVEGG